MDGYWIVYGGLDSGRLQLGLNAIPLMYPHGIEVVYVPCIRDDGGRQHAGIREQTVIGARDFTAPLGPFFELAEFHAQNGGLHGLQAIVVACDDGPVLLLLSPIAEQAHGTRVFGIVCNGHAAFAGGAQVFRWIEAEAADVADGANAPAAILGSVRLRG